MFVVFLVKSVFFTQCKTKCVSERVRIEEMNISERIVTSSFFRFICSVVAIHVMRNS